jgi:hypothetical protein
MRTKLFFPTLLVLALILSACSPVLAVKPEAQSRTLNVTGSAQVMLIPDVAYLSIGVHTQHENATEALNQNNAQAQKVMEILQVQGIDAKDMQTTGFGIYPQQQYDQNGQMTGILYVVDNVVYVTIRNLDTVGQVLGAVVTAGANNINGISFDVLDKSVFLTEARKAAIANARSQAEEIASAAGVKLGEIQSINFYSNYPVPVMVDNKAVGIGGGGSVPISPGQLTVNVDVNIVFEIE